MKRDFRYWNCSKAVSYTHLDVYKRQGVNLPALVEAVSAQMREITLEEAVSQIREVSVMRSYKELLNTQKACDDDE